MESNQQKVEIDQKEVADFLEQYSEIFNTMVKQVFSDSDKENLQVQC